MNPLDTGTIKAWNDTRGFGFVRPDSGGGDVFLHATALPPQGPRPQVGDRVRYQRVLSADLKPRAAGARLLDASAAPSPSATAARPASRAQAKPAPAHQVRPQQPGSRPSRSGFGIATLFWLIGFAMLYTVYSALWRVPAWVGIAYLGLSAVTYAVYAADKRAAAANAWRVSEQNLLLLGLAGGWPGAIVAQQRLRHKSSKASFQQAFWGTVVLNIAGFVMLASPLGRHWLGGA